MIYKEIVKDIENVFAGHVGEVTFGDIGEIDVTSITEFPLVHIEPLGTEAKVGHTLFGFNIYILNTKEALEDPIDVLDDMSDIIITFASWYNSSLYSIDTLPEAKVKYDFSGNRLYGFVLEGASFVAKTIKPC